VTFNRLAAATCVRCFCFTSCNTFNRSRSRWLKAMRSVSMGPSANHESGHFYFAQTGHFHFAATSLVGALLHSFRCASIRVVRRSEQELFVRPSPPPHGDPGAAATFSSLSSNLPGAGPRPKSSARTSPSGGLHEELSHQGHSKRRHCRPRRHREDATGVVVTLHLGNDAAVGKSCGRQHHHRLGRRRNRSKDFHSNVAG